MASDTPSGLTRYSVHTEPVEYKRPTVQPILTEDEVGKWCRYSDVAPIVERCERIEASARELIHDVRRLWEQLGLPADSPIPSIDRARAALKGETTDE